MSSNIATELSPHEKLMRVHGYLRGTMEYDHGVMGGNLAGKTPSQIIEELIETPSVSVETKTEENAGKPEPLSNHVAAVLQNALQGVLVDLHNQRTGWGNTEFLNQCERRVRKALHLCANCGKPGTCLGQYEDLREGFACDDCCGHGNEDGYCEPVSAPSVGVGGNSHVVGASLKSHAPASGKFKMSIFEELLIRAQEASKYLITFEFGSREYELGIALQLAIERAAK